MRKLFMVIFGLLLVAICYHSPPITIEHSNDVNYDLSGSVPIIHSIIIETAPAVIKGPLYKICNYEKLYEDNLYDPPSLAEVLIRINKIAENLRNDQGLLELVRKDVMTRKFYFDINQLGFEQSQISQNRLLRVLSFWPSLNAGNNNNFELSQYILS